MHNPKVDSRQRGGAIHSVRGLVGWVNGITIAEMGLPEPLERAAELKQLSALLASARDGHGQACVIEGSSGVGKTRLLDECAGAAEALGMCALRARCRELTRDYPFSIVHSSSTRPSFAPMQRRAPNCFGSGGSR